MPYFYPRPPRGGRLVQLIHKRLAFLISIHALREEGDGTVYGFYSVQIPISIHALREEGDCSQMELCQRHPISIHALREEGDFLPSTTHIMSSIFLSTPSARRATALEALVGVGAGISIHALREEGDPH